MRNSLYRFVFISILFLCGCHTTPSVQLCAPEIPVEIFKSADIVFRLGRTIESDLIASSGNDTTHYSHVGVIINRNGNLSVVHIEPTPNREDDIIKEETLQDFFSSDKSLAGCVVRMGKLTLEECNIVQESALHLLDTNVKFDHDYRISDSHTMYCAELVEHIFSLTGNSLSQGRMHKLPFLQEPVILPSDIMQNSNLEVVWSY